jgi:hypothetical protein
MQLGAWMCFRNLMQGTLIDNAAALSQTNLEIGCMHRRDPKAQYIQDRYIKIYKKAKFIEK